MTTPVEVRARLVDLFRRDLVGPGPQDEDLARERLSENPSRWYLTGFIAPADDEPAADDPTAQEEDDREAESESGSGAGGAAGDDEPSDAPAARRRFLPSSIGLTVLLPPSSARSRRGSAGAITSPNHHCPRLHCCRERKATKRGTVMSIGCACRSSVQWS